MPKLKALSGKEVIGVLEELGFSVVNQKGSHVKLKRVVDGGISQTLTIPNHSDLDKGTLKAIYNQAVRYVPGVNIQQGEGNRDQITIRGNVTTADFFIDGVPFGQNFV